MKPDRESDLVRVHHMLDFALKAVTFNKGCSRQDLDLNEMRAMATIHLIEMLGEASRQVSDATQQKYPDIPWSAIAGTRNRLAHGYIDVDLDIIWTIVTRDLPKLVPQLRKLLRGEEA